LHCRACGSSNLALRGHKPGRFIRREFAFHACRDCGLMFVEPFSGFEIYDDAYYRGAGPDPYVDYETEYRDWRRTDRGLEFDDMVRIAGHHLRRHEAPAAGRARARDGRAMPGTLHWLDFGCGAGAFLKYLREKRTLAGRTLELTGHDVGSYAELLKRADGFRILDLVEIAREPDAQFDVISMIEVIEHLPEPDAAIALLARLLKPGGLLLLTTGNMEGPIARRQGIHYRYCAPEIHVSLFNPRCLEQLYRRHGLEPRFVRYHGAVKFKALKSLRHRPLLRAIARAVLLLPPAVRTLDALYAVSAMPCAVKPQ
jgi:SAM-dependent methyltransferase